jgi:hypothetical protein
VFCQHAKYIKIRFLLAVFYNGNKAQQIPLLRHRSAAYSLTAAFPAEQGR